jgi:hypothetical protein
VGPHVFIKPVLEATHRKPVRLIVIIPVDRGVAVIQVASPRITTTLRRRPEVHVVRPIVVRTIGIPVARGRS